MTDAVHALEGQSAVEILRSASREYGSKLTFAAALACGLHIAPPDWKSA